MAHDLYQQNSLYGVEDLIQIGMMTVTKILDKYDESRQTKLSTFLCLCARREMIRFIKKQSKRVYVRKPTSYVEEIPYFELSDGMTDKEKQILEMLISGYSIREILKIAKYREINIVRSKINA